MARLATHHVPRSKMRPTDFCQFTLTMTSTHTSTVPARVEPDRGNARISRCRAPLRSAVRAASQALSSWLDDRRPTSGGPVAPPAAPRLRRACAPRTRPRSFPTTPREESHLPRSGDTFRRLGPFSGLPRTSTLRAAVRTSIVRSIPVVLPPGPRPPFTPPHEHQLAGRRFSRPDDRLTTSATRTIRGHAPGRSILAARRLPRLPDCRPRALSERTVTRFPDCEPQRRTASFRSWPPLAERGAFCGPRGHEQGDVRRRSPPRRDGGTPRRLRTAYVASWRLAPVDARARTLAGPKGPRTSFPAKGGEAQRPGVPFTTKECLTARPDPRIRSSDEAVPSFRFRRTSR